MLFLVIFGFVLLVSVFVSVCWFLSVSYENHCFPCNFSVFVIKNESLFLISVSGSCFLFLFCLLLVP